MTKKKSKKSTHIHKYKRVNLTRNPGKKPYIVFACQLPGCDTYHTRALLVGKLTECWTCSDPFVLDKISIEHAKPHCVHCIKRKIKPVVEDLSELVKDI